MRKPNYVTLDDLNVGDYFYLVEEKLAGIRRIIMACLTGGRMVLDPARGVAYRAEIYDRVIPATGPEQSYEDALAAITPTRVLQRVDSLPEGTLVKYPTGQALYRVRTAPAMETEDGRRFPVPADKMVEVL